MISDSSNDECEWIGRVLDPVSYKVVDDGKAFIVVTLLSSVKMFAIKNKETKRIENIEVSFII